jgi:hypothetical protein
MNFKIVGSSFRPDFIKDTIYPSIRVGCKGVLVREFGNPHDPDAIKVIVRIEERDSFHFVGYIPKGSKEAYSEDFKSATFEVTSVGPSGKFLKVLETVPNHIDKFSELKEILK